MVMLPPGWTVNPDEKVVAAIMRRLGKTDNHCPCVPEAQWDEGTVCPCKEMREGRGCHCGLYVYKEELVQEKIDGSTITPSVLPMTVDAMVQESWGCADEKGWHDKERDFGSLMMLLTTEVAEAFEEFRNGHAPTETYYSEGGKPEGIPAELADVVIRIGDICGTYGIDLAAAIAEKQAYNRTRPYRHGNKVA